MAFCRVMGQKVQDICGQGGKRKAKRNEKALSIGRHPFYSMYQHGRIVFHWPCRSRAREFGSVRLEVGPSPS